MSYKDDYTILGVGRTAGAEVIQRAYRELPRKYHPDVSQESDAEVRVDVPKKLTDVERELLEKLAQVSKFRPRGQTGG